MKKSRWPLRKLIALVAAVPIVVSAVKLNAKLVQCKKTKVRNEDGALVYLFTVQSREASHSGRTEAILYVEVKGADGKSYFGVMRNKLRLLSFFKGGSYADAYWRFEVNIDPIQKPILAAYLVELIDGTNDQVLDSKSYGVGNPEEWKARNANSARLTIKALQTDPAIL